MQLINSSISWDKIGIEFAKTIATKSKDPRTKVGAVLMSPDHREIAVGYNGFPSTIKDLEERWQRPTKYDYVLHAEENAILNSKKDLTGWTLFVTLMPCKSCALKIAQSGITRIVYIKDFDAAQDWADKDFVENILAESSIKIEQWTEEGNDEPSGTD